ncbi:TrmH family RNA methyltransferase [Candidatus Wolfebacteria bacterium]|nr:TrmH family RNA methyltransferase [Candidatus Wolfebacteria bacterium]
MVAILYNIRSLYNVGSIFRTADGAGIEKLYLCGITPAPVDRFGNVRKQFSKVALGAHNYVPWEKVKRIETVIDCLKKEGYTIVALEQDKKAIPYCRMKIKRVPTALILGNEVRGLPLSVLKRADKILEIPMRGSKESLNVAIAFGIVAFHLLGER